MSFHPLPADAGHCILVPDFLTQAECDELIALSEWRGYSVASTDYPPSYRNNHRHVIDSHELARRLDERLRGHAPASVAIDGGPWEYAGVNERLRFCRYGAGQRFNLHQDGVHHRGPGCRSRLTVLVYLNDGAAFTGGDTVFYAQGPAHAVPQELGRVRPRAGSLLLFDHEIWHAGEEVTAGTKHVLRSDVLYRSAADAAPSDPAEHEGYIWTLRQLDDGLTASGGRDATIRVRDESGRTTGLLRGHEQSVLGLAPLPEGRLASVSRDRSLRIWNLSRGACETQVRAHDSAVLDVVNLADGRLATGGADGLVKLWSQDGGAVGNLAGHEGWVWQLAALDDGRLASASEDGSVRIWETASLHCTAVLEGGEPLRTVLVPGDGTIWTGDIAGRIARWSCADGAWTRTAPFHAHRAAIRRLRQVGPGLVASCGEDRALRIWDARTLAQRFEAWHDNFVTDVLRRGDALLSSSYDGRVRRHDLALLREEA